MAEDTVLFPLDQNLVSILRFSPNNGGMPSESNTSRDKRSEEEIYTDQPCTLGRVRPRRGAESAFSKLRVQSSGQGEPVKTERPSSLPSKSLPCHPPPQALCLPEPSPVQGNALLLELTALHSSSWSELPIAPLFCENLATTPIF